MQINVDMNQMYAEQEQLYEMCKQHKECKGCVIKEKGAVNIGTTILGCENMKVNE